MSESSKNQKRYDLEERTMKFAQGVRSFVRKLPRSVQSQEDGRQVVRSSGSVGANYIEANESLSKKDFSHRVRLCRKEAKETRYWLQLFELDAFAELAEERDKLAQEAKELVLIFSAILESVSRPREQEAVREKAFSSLEF